MAVDEVEEERKKKLRPQCEKEIEREGQLYETKEERGREEKKRQ